MAVYAISDLHLSFGSNKPMDIFGGRWENHAERIRENWLKTISEEDTVLLPGDFSWAIDLIEADPDFVFLEKLPGQKIISKGNHDYWWSTLTKISQYFQSKQYNSIRILHNNAYAADNIVISGTRGWMSPDEEGFSKEDMKVFLREIERLKLSLHAAKKLGGDPLVMLHYPPFDSRRRPNDFGRVMAEYGVKHCIYGHIHGRAKVAPNLETIEGITYQLVSSDYLNFNPTKLDII